jgi:tetratricopeptide (TPR) repeat protein
MSMAELYMRTERFDDAIQHAQLALTAHPGAARMTIAQAYFAKRDLAAAEREAQALTTDPDKRNDAVVLLAQIRTVQRRFPDAAALLDALKSRADASGETIPPNYWFARGDVLARMNRLPEAEQAFAQEVRLYPRNREAFVRMAVLQTLAGREAEARRTFDAMIRLNPDASSRRMAAEAVAQLKRQGAR